MFAAEAVLEEGNPLKVLSFEFDEAEKMRMSEFMSYGSWTFDDMSKFLNAYRIGNRYFVLRRQLGYESGGVELQELDFKEGVLETNLALRFGC